jgi:hypothetical protein
MSQDSSVSIVVGCGLDDGFDSQGRSRDFSILRHVHTGSWAYPAS